VDQTRSEARESERRKRPSARGRLAWSALSGRPLAALVLLAGIVALAHSPDVDDHGRAIGKERVKLELFMPSAAVASQESPCAKQTGQDDKSPPR